MTARHLTSGAAWQVLQLSVVLVFLRLISPQSATLLAEIRRQAVRRVEMCLLRRLEGRCSLLLHQGWHQVAGCFLCAPRRLCRVAEFWICHHQTRQREKRYSEDERLLVWSRSHCVQTRGVARARQGGREQARLDGHQGQQCLLC